MPPRWASSPSPGVSFILSATVRNQGSGSSAVTTLRYYRSTNSSISSSDTAVGTDFVSGLSASGTSPESIGLTAPFTAGTYHYGACVDSVSGESDTTNSCFSGVAATVPKAVDITVTDCTCTYNPNTGVTRVTLEGTVSVNLRFISLELTGYVVEGGDETEIDDTTFYNLLAGDEEDFDLSGTVDGRPSTGWRCLVKVTDYDLHPLQ